MLANLRWRWPVDKEKPTMVILWVAFSSDLIIHTKDQESKLHELLIY